MTAPSPSPDNSGNSGNSGNAVPRRRKWSVDQGIALIVVALISAAAGYFGKTGAVNGNPQPRPTVTVTASQQATKPSLVKSDITFQEPQDGDRVRQCPIVEGYGQIPAGETLWIVVVPDTSEQPRQYWIESRAKMDGPDHWHAVDAVSIDTPKTSGVNASIYAILLDRRWGAYFSSSTAEGNFYASSLPPTDSSVAAPMTVTRVADPGGKSCLSGGA